MGRRSLPGANVGLAGALLLVAALAGCTSDGGLASVTQRPSEVDLDVGLVLAGQVVTREFIPVAGASVVVGDRPMVVTGPQGTFAVGGLEAGDHVVRIEALGFETLEQKVRIVAGENPPVEFVLNEIGVPRPYTEVVILRGYSICDVSFFVVITTIDNTLGSCPLGTPNRRVIVNVSADWQYAVIEMTWHAVESFALYTSNDENCVTSNPCYGAVMGRSPLRIEAAPNDEAVAKRYAPYGPPAYDGPPKQYPTGPFDVYVNTLYAGALQSQVNGSFNDFCDEGVGINFGCPGLGANAAGIDFTVFASIFHVERPADPSKYAARE